MSGVPMDPRRLEAEAGWPDLARDLVHLTLPNPGRRMALDDVLANYNLSPRDLDRLLTSERFRELLERELGRAKELGHRAGHVFRVEAMLTVLAERMLVMALSEEATLQDAIRTFTALLQSVGGVESQRQGGPVTNIQINVPNLRNPKLRHVDGVQLPAD